MIKYLQLIQWENTAVIQGKQSTYSRRKQKGERETKLKKKDVILNCEREILSVFSQ